jgi:hypothetical protein
VKKLHAPPAAAPWAGGAWAVDFGAARLRDGFPLSYKIWGLKSGGAASFGTFVESGLAKKFILDFIKDILIFDDMHIVKIKKQRYNEFISFQYPFATSACQLLIFDISPFPLF